MLVGGYPVNKEFSLGTQAIKLTKILVNSAQIKSMIHNEAKISPHCKSNGGNIAA